MVLTPRVNVKSRYSLPRDLVHALHERDPGSRSALADLLREPLSRLMGELAKRHGLSQSGDRLTVQALHAAETFLRTRPISQFAALSWQAFRGAVLFHIAKLASLPFGGREGGGAGPGPLPESDIYHSEALSLPSQRVGEFWFGGDWYAGRHHGDGSLWVLLADVTGHGYFAYLLASCLPAVWDDCWNRVGPAGRPAELLAAMHNLLADCLPEGIYAECTLAQLRPDGEVIVAPAGGSRLLLRRAGTNAAAIHKLRGTWLGLAQPSIKDERSWRLDRGDEILLATDGVFDHLANQDPTLPRLLGRIAGPISLFDHTHDVLREALVHSPQRDDMTMVLLRRRHVEGAASQCDGDGDVRV